MSKLLVSTLLLSSFLYAQSSSEAVEEFLEDKIFENPNVASLKVKVVDKIKLDNVKGWDAYVVSLDAVLKQNKKEVRQKMIWFSNGQMITRDFTDMHTGESLKDLVKPSFQKQFYKPENLIYGNKNAKHKVVIFSDPLCPFCRGFVPKAIEDMKKEPKKFALYYFNFPLPAIHPASITLVKAEIAAELKGHKDTLLKLYKVKVNPREKEEIKILDAFTKATGVKISPEDIHDKKVEQRYKQDLFVAEEMMVGGTPTLFFDGKIDKTKKLYTKVK